MRAGLEPNLGDTSDGGQQVHSGARSAIPLGSRDSGRRQMVAPTGYPHGKRLWFIAQSHKKEQIETASTLVERPTILRLVRFGFSSLQQLRFDHVARVVGGKNKIK